MPDPRGSPRPDTISVKFANTNPKLEAVARVRYGGPVRRDDEAVIGGAPCDGAGGATSSVELVEPSIEGQASQRIRARAHPVAHVTP
jgi:hypothetical protein